MMDAAARSNLSQCGGVDGDMHCGESHARGRQCGGQVSRVTRGARAPESRIVPGTSAAGSTPARTGSLKARSDTELPEGFLDPEANAVRFRAEPHLPADGILPHEGEVTA